MNNEILDASLVSLASLIHRQEISPLEVTQKLLSRIEAVNKENHAYTYVSAERALLEAKSAEEALINGDDKGPLHGVPLSVKDNIAVEHLPTTNGFNSQAHREVEDASIVTRLRSSGGIILGKTNMDEFANHVIGENHTFGYIKNPIKDGYTIGGSSGGSAASVAAKMAYGSIGTDTSGSVRIPAACSAIVGLKPTYGLLPMQGITPLSWSVDHAGILAKNIDDTSLLFHSLTPGKREMKMTDLFITPAEVDHLTVGVPEEFIFTDIAPDVKSAFDQVIKKLESAGAKIIPFKLRSLNDYSEAHYVIVATESGYTHARTLHRNKEQLESFNRGIFTDGLQIPKTEYMKALQAVEIMNGELKELFQTIDVILSPTMPIIPPATNTENVYWGNREEPALAAMIRYTAPYNMSGLPALTLNGGTSSTGLPIGMQLAVKPYMEKDLLRIGKATAELI